MKRPAVAVVTLDQQIRPHGCSPKTPELRPEPAAGDRQMHVEDAFALDADVAKEVVAGFGPARLHACAQLAEGFGDSARPFMNVGSDGSDPSGEHSILQCAVLVSSSCRKFIRKAEKL